MGICILRIKKPGLGNNGTIAFALFFFVIALYDTRRSSSKSTESNLCLHLKKKKICLGWGGAGETKHDRALQNGFLMPFPRDDDDLFSPRRQSFALSSGHIFALETQFLFYYTYYTPSPISSAPLSQAHRSWE